MEYSDFILRELRRAFYKYSRQIGKYRKDEALSLLKHLALSEKADKIIRILVDEAYEKDAFAGYLRTEAISIRIQLHAIRAGGGKNWPFELQN